MITCPQITPNRNKSKESIYRTKRQSLDHFLFSLSIEGKKRLKKFRHTTYSHISWLAVKRIWLFSPINLPNTPLSSIIWATKQFKQFNNNFQIKPKESHSHMSKFNKILIKKNYRQTNKGKILLRELRQSLLSIMLKAM